MLLYSPYWILCFLEAITHPRWDFEAPQLNCSAPALIIIGHREKWNFGALAACYDACYFIPSLGLWHPPGVHNSPKVVFADNTTELLTMQ
jgi:hypothetical protein